MSTVPQSWKVGDRGVCISAFPEYSNLGQSAQAVGITLPQVGMTYIVTNVHGRSSRGHPYLGLGGYPTKVSFCASRFRKIVPACDRITESVHNVDPTTAQLFKEFLEQRRQRSHQPKQE